MFLFLCVYTSLIFKQMAVPALFFLCADFAGILQHNSWGSQSSSCHFLFVNLCLLGTPHSHQQKRCLCLRKFLQTLWSGLRKVWVLQTWLNKRIIATFCYFITTCSSQIQQFVVLLFLLFSPALMRGRERILASWRKALRTIGLIKGKSCFVRFVLQHLEIWVKSLVGSSWALKFLCIFYPSGTFSSGFAFSSLCWWWDFSAALPTCPLLAWKSLLQRV